MTAGEKRGQEGRGEKERRGEDRRRGGDRRKGEESELCVICVGVAHLEQWNTRSLLTNEGEPWHRLQ